eukprot:3280352-Rhodomonas_salina.2
MVAKCGASERFCKGSRDRRAVVKETTAHSDAAAVLGSERETAVWNFLAVLCRSSVRAPRVRRRGGL